MKKTMRYMMLCAVCAALLPSCEEEMTADADTDRRIYLRATVEGATTTTRAPYILTTPNRDNPLEVAVWASTTQSLFANRDDANGKNGEVAIHTSANFTNGSEQLLDEAVYPKTTGGTTRKVYFVGLHPKTGWETTTGDTTAVHSTAIDGKTDVMFAPQISGEYSGNTSGDKWPTFEFHHLLTWLRIQMVAESEEVRTAWGPVTDLTIKSKTKVSVNLKGTTALANAATFLGDETDLHFYHKDTDDEFPKGGYYKLNAPYGNGNIYDEVDEVAYVLCAPVEATATDPETGNATMEYTLTVTTEKRTVTVDVDLMNGADTHFSGSTRNHQFVLLLKFKMGDNISVIAHPVDWQTGGLGSGELEEN